MLFSDYRQFGLMSAMYVSVLFRWAEVHCPAWFSALILASVGITVPAKLHDMGKHTVIGFESRPSWSRAKYSVLENAEMRSLSWATEVCAFRFLLSLALFLWDANVRHLDISLEVISITICVNWVSVSQPVWWWISDVISVAVCGDLGWEGTVERWLEKAKFMLQRGLGQFPHLQLVYY